MFTDIEKNIILRLNGDMCQSYWLTESELESLVTMLTQKWLYHWFDRSRFAVSDRQISKLHSKFYFIHDSKKSQDCTAKSPNPKL